MPCGTIHAKHAVLHAYKITPKPNLPQRHQPLAQESPRKFGLVVFEEALTSPCVPQPLYPLHAQTHAWIHVAELGNDGKWGALFFRFGSFSPLARWVKNSQFQSLICFSCFQACNSVTNRFGMPSAHKAGANVLGTTGKACRDYRPWQRAKRPLIKGTSFVCKPLPVDEADLRKHGHGTAAFNGSHRK